MMNYIVRYLLDIAVMMVIYRLCFYPMWKTEDKRQFRLKSLMYIYICLVLCVTLLPVLINLPFVGHFPYRSMNLNPFASLLKQKPYALLQVVLNIFMLMPFGFLFPLIKGKGLIKCVGSAFLFSLMIEIVQPLVSTFRVSDITDLITNTIGSGLGYICYLGYDKLSKKQNAVEMEAKVAYDTNELNRRTLP